MPVSTEVLSSPNWIRTSNPSIKDISLVGDVLPLVA
nr:MAG TPA: hypothetical protein [Caudoviricetes sp.]